MKCYRKNGSDSGFRLLAEHAREPSMKCYRKNGSDRETWRHHRRPAALNEVLPKER